MSFSALLPMLLGVLGLGGAYYLYKSVKAYPGGEGKIADIRNVSEAENDAGDDSQTILELVESLE